MTASPRSLSDVAVLDQHITDALVVLRLARAARTRSTNATSLRAEADAESSLNGLLECRHLAQRRPPAAVGADISR
jgi:hypothetical protein